MRNSVLYRHIIPLILSIITSSCSNQGINPTPQTYFTVLPTYASQSKPNSPTATIRPEPSPTAYPSPTVPSPTPSPTYTSTPQSPCSIQGKLIFEDNFQEINTLWRFGTYHFPNTTENRKIRENSLRYSVEFLNNAHTYMLLPSEKVENLYLTFTARLIAHEGSYPASVVIIFRHKDASNYYIVRINNEGMYSIESRIDGNLSTIISWSSYELAKWKSGNANQISIIVDTFLITICLNGDDITTVTETGLLDSGSIGIGVSSGAGSTVIYDFDDFTLNIIE